MLPTLEAVGLEGAMEGKTQSSQMEETKKTVYVQLYSLKSRQAMTVCH